MKGLRSTCLLLAALGVGAWAQGPTGEIGGLVTDSTSYDFSAIKKFRFTERTGLEFRSEFFNLPNHPIFNPPGASLRTPAYGVMTATRIDSRQIQFGLRLHF